MHYIRGEYDVADIVQDQYYLNELHICKFDIYKNRNGKVFLWKSVISSPVIVECDKNFEEQ